MLKTKYIILFLVFFLIFIYFLFKYSNKIQNKYIGNEQFYYPYNKKMAYISTWDDIQGIDSYTRIDYLCKIINLKMPITMFIDTKNLYKNYNINKIKYLLNGEVPHTIESHSVSHSIIKKINNNKNEYIKSQKEIKNIFGQKYADTYCYPYGFVSPNKDIKNLIENTYIAARNTQEGYFSTEDLFNIKCIPIEKMKEEHITHCIKNGKTIVSYGHGITEYGGYNPISEKNFITHLNILKKYEEDIWFVTFPEFIKYLEKTNQLKKKFN